MPEELKPCPFCGGKAMNDREDIFCQDCNAKIGKAWPQDSVTYEEATQEAIEAWNTRT